MKKATYLQLLRTGGLLLVAAVLLTVAPACHNDLKKDQGIIVSDLGEACDLGGLATSDEYVITNSTELSAAIGGTGCSPSSFGNVNFNNHYLLGKQIKGKCKIKKIFTQVKQETESKRIVFKILVKDRGGCDTEVDQWVWVTVPKFSSDYTVFFVVEKR